MADHGNGRGGAVGEHRSRPWPRSSRPRSGRGVSTGAPGVRHGRRTGRGGGRGSARSSSRFRARDGLRRSLGWGGCSAPGAAGGDVVPLEPPPCPDRRGLPSRRAGSTARREDSDRVDADIRATRGGHRVRTALRGAASGHIGVLARPGRSRLLRSGARRRSGRRERGPSGQRHRVEQRDLLHADQ